MRTRLARLINEFLSVITTMSPEKPSQDAVVTHAIVTACGELWEAFQESPLCPQIFLNIHYRVSKDLFDEVFCKNEDNAAKTKEDESQLSKVQSKWISAAMRFFSLARVASQVAYERCTTSNDRFLCTNHHSHPLARTANAEMQLSPGNDCGSSFGRAVPHNDPGDKMSNTDVVLEPSCIPEHASDVFDSQTEETATSSDALNGSSATLTVVASGVCASDSDRRRESLSQVTFKPATSREENLARMSLAKAHTSIQNYILRMEKKSGENGAAKCGWVQFYKS